MGAEGIGGMNVYLKELCTALARESNVEVDIFTRNKNLELDRIKMLGANVRIVHLPAGPACFVDRKSLYGYLPEFMKNLKVFICREGKNYDVIYTHYWLSGLVGGYLKPYFAIPLVHTYHTLAFLKDRVSREHEHKSRSLAEQHLAHTADLIISSSAEEKQNLISEYEISPQNIKVIYPGVNQKIFYPSNRNAVFEESGFSSDSKILLYVGRVEPIKGLMSLIEAFALLHKSQSFLRGKLKLIVIGGGRSGPELSNNREACRVKAAVEAFGLNDRIVFLGSKKQESLREFYSAADVLVVPSLYESFGLVVVEALACGTPVLVSHVGKMKSIVKEGKNGFSFAPGSPGALANGIEEFFFKKDLLWEAEKIWQDIIGRFSWEKTARETYSIFTGLTKQKASSTTKFRPDESPQLI